MELSAGIPAPAKLSYSGSEHFDLAAGKRLQLRTLAPTTDLLDEVVPAGKTWSVFVTVTITEVDA